MSPEWAHISLQLKASESFEALGLEAGQGIFFLKVVTWAVAAAQHGVLSLGG